MGWMRGLAWEEKHKGVSAGPAVKRRGDSAMDKLMACHLFTSSVPSIIRHFLEAKFPAAPETVLPRVVVAEVGVSSRVPGGSAATVPIFDIIGIRGSRDPCTD